jgi:hypothetical protein
MIKLHKLIILLWLHEFEHKVQPGQCTGWEYNLKYIYGIYKYEIFKHLQNNNKKIVQPYQTTVRGCSNAYNSNKMIK